MPSEEKTFGFFEYFLLTTNLVVIFEFILVLLAWMELDFWLSELAVSFMPQQLAIAWVVIILNIVLWFVGFGKKSWLFRTSLVTTAIFALQIALYGSFVVFSFAFDQPREEVATDSRTLKAVMFNKLLSNDNYEEIAEAVRQVNPDIIGFVEISPASYLSSLLEKSYAYQIRSFDHSGENGFLLTNLAIYSKTELIDVDFRNLNGSPLLKARTQVDGQSYQIILVHPYAPYLPRLLPERNKQLQAIARNVNELEVEGVPQILLGDMNTSPWSRAYYRFAAGIPDLYNTAQGKGVNFTWDAFKFKGLTSELDSIIFQSHIDHIFVSDELQTLGYKVEGNYGSDHNLVWVEMSKN